MLVVQGLIASFPSEVSRLSSQEAHEILETKLSALFAKAEEQKAQWLVLKAPTAEQGSVSEQAFVAAWLDEVRAKQRRSKRVLWPVLEKEGAEEVLSGSLMGWAALAQETHTEILAMDAAWWRALERSETPQPYLGEKGAVLSLAQLRSPSSSDTEVFRHVGCDFWILDLSEAPTIGDWDALLTEADAWRSGLPRWKPMLLAGVTMEQHTPLLKALEPRRSRFLGLLWSTH
ncbi:MAG: hypothetical protein H6728_08575 [Myxococcales bacterium]|nr:hypothetical protein [Myxococcales bacterium]MCB9643115.1 hypothetical protein [Myxococcales bacterium]